MLLTKVKLVTFSGFSGCGKDTAAEFLIQQYGFVKIAIANPLKRLVQSKYNLTDEQLWGNLRNAKDIRYSKSPRQIYQEEGDLLRHKDPLALIKLWETEIQKCFEIEEKVICPDVRTKMELNVVHKLNGKCFLIQRKQSGAPGLIGQHSTELELPNSPELFDIIIDNNSSIENLYSELQKYFQN